MQIKMWQALKTLEIYKRIKNQYLPAKVAYRLNKLYNELEKTSTFYHEELNKIIAEYCEKNEDGTPKVLEDGSGIKIKEEFIEEAKTEAEELWNLDIDAPDIKISLNDLDNIKLSIEELNAVSPFIKEE